MTDQRSPKNVQGPFYVVKDACISCRAPEAEARGLMLYDEEQSSCFFERQPTTPEEEDRAIRAVWASCCGAVRYGGTDSKVVARLEESRTWACGERGDFCRGPHRIRTRCSPSHRSERGGGLCRFHRQ